MGKDLRRVRNSERKKKIGLGSMERKACPDILSDLWGEILVPEGLVDSHLFAGLGGDAPLEAPEIGVCRDPL